MIDEGQLSGLAEAAGAEGVRAILEAFWTSTQELSSELTAAVANSDADNVMKLGHALKGSSANLGAAKMAERAKAIEDAARDGNLETVQKMLSEFAQDVAQTRVAMDGLLARFA